MLKDAQPTEVPAEADTAESAPPPPAADRPAARPVAEPPKILEETVIEEVSIDGMCGVY